MRQNLLILVGASFVASICTFGLLLPFSFVMLAIYGLWEGIDAMMPTNQSAVSMDNFLERAHSNVSSTSVDTVPVSAAKEQQTMAEPPPTDDSGWAAISDSW